MTGLLVPLLVLGCKNEEAELVDDAVVPGELRVEQPAAGAFVPDGTTTVSGVAKALRDVTVNRQTANLSGDRFDTVLDLPRGITTLEVQGVDGTGHTMFTRHSVLAGDFGPADAKVADALQLRVNQAGLDYVGDILRGFMNPVELMAAFTDGSPTYHLYDPQSIPFVDDLDVDIYLTALDFGQLQVVATPMTERVHLSLSLPAPYIQMQTWGTIPYLDDTEGDRIHILADELRIEADLSLDVDAQGRVRADIYAVDVGMPNLYVEWEYLWESVNWLIGLFDLEGTITGLVEGALVDFAAPLVETAFGVLNTTLETELLGQTLSIQMQLADISSDVDGIAFYADLAVDVPERIDHDAPGYLVAPPADPDPDPLAPISVGLSDNLVNRVLHEAWAGGMVELTLSTDDGSLDPFVLAARGASQGSIQVSAGLPPVIVERNGRLTAQLGEVDLTLLTPGGDQGERLEVTMAAATELELKVEDGEIVVGLGDPDLSFVVRDSDWGASNETITRLLEAELPIDVLLLLLGEFRFPLPVIEGFEIASATTERDASGVYTNVSVTLR